MLYASIAKKCEKRGCCMESAKRMTAGNFQLADIASATSLVCPAGFQKTQLKCEGSYVWCEPINFK